MFYVWDPGCYIGYFHAGKMREERVGIYPNIRSAERDGASQNRDRPVMVRVYPVVFIVS